VTLTILDERDSLVVIVTDTAGEDQDGETRPSQDPFELVSGASADASNVLDVLPSGFGLAVIAGLVDDLDVVRGPTGTVVRMTWKSPARDGGDPATSQAAEESPT
jgi:hypothetical protein